MKSGNSSTVGGTPPQLTIEPKLHFWTLYKDYETCVKTLLGEGIDVKLCVSVPDGIKDSNGNLNYAYANSNAPRLNKLTKPVYMGGHSNANACAGYLKSIDSSGKGDQKKKYNTYYGLGYSYDENTKNCYVTSNVKDITEDNFWKPPPPPSPPSPSPKSPPSKKSSSHVGLILGITIPLIIIIIALVAYFLIFKK